MPETSTTSTRSPRGSLHLLQRIDLFTERTGGAIAWLNLAMVILMCVVVVLRYAFNVSLVAVQEGVMYLHAFIFMLASAYTLKSNDHVRVDIFYQRFSPKQQAVVNLLGTLLLLLPTILFIAFASWNYVLSAWRIHEVSQEASGIPLVYLLKTLIPVMVGLLFIQAMAELLRNLLILSGTATHLVQAAPAHTPCAHKDA